MNANVESPGAPTVGPEGISALKVVVLAVLTGFAVGAFTSPAQGWFAGSLGSLANSAGPWSVAAFMVARRARRVPLGVVAGVVTLAMCEIGYVVANEIRGIANANSTVAFWLIAAALAGPPLGIAAVWSARDEPFSRGAGFGVIAGVMIGEGAYAWDRVSDTTDWRFWAAEVALGVAVVAAVSARARSARTIASCGVGAAATAAVVYGVAVSF